MDCGLGNPASVQNMLRRAGHESRISREPAEAAAAERFILPGVGAFDAGMERLARTGWDRVLTHEVMQNGKPFLGICLGAQLVTRRSEEGSRPGLGWMDAETVAFDRTRLGPGLKVPHMGWARVRVTQEIPLVRNLPPQSRFYFVHSFCLAPRSQEEAFLWAWHGYPFVAGIVRGHVAGVQFHPEKSHRFGLQLLDNFVTLSPAG